MTAEVTHTTSPVPDNANLSKIAFVLAGGGSFGSVQVGMLRALVARGVTADMVVGSSVGAMNAAIGEPINDLRLTPINVFIALLRPFWRAGSENLSRFMLGVNPSHEMPNGQFWHEVWVPACPP